MAEPQLSVRSAKARDLAHRLARREHRSIADVVERALESYEIREAGREPAAAFYARLSKSYGEDIDLEAIIREGRRTNPGPKLIFLDTNVVSETLRKTPDAAVLAWLARYDAELALPTVTIAEITYGIRKISPDQRAARLEQGLTDWRHQFADRIFGLTESAALAYGDIMGAAARRGQAMTAPDGMIAAIARVNDGRLATRNLSDFATTGLDLLCPWDF